MRRVATAWLAVMCLSGALASAQRAAATAAISGVVVDAVTKAPIVNAVVFLGPRSQSANGIPPRQLTDAKGRFLFRNLPAFASYTIEASRFGYFAGGFGRRRPYGRLREIALDEGQWFRDANVSLQRASAISGVVRDELGEPVAGAYVRIITKVADGGTTYLAVGQVVATDDRGVYRIANLEAGRYLVHVPIIHSTVPAAAATDAPPPGFPLPGPPARDGLRQVGDRLLAIGGYPTPRGSGSAVAYASTFHPGTRELSAATWVSIGTGEERTGVDVRLEPVPVHRVSGRVQGPPDGYQGLMVRLLAAGTEALGEGAETATATIGPDGTFTFLNVPDGSYTIAADSQHSQVMVADTLPPTLTLPSPQPTTARDRIGTDYISLSPVSARLKIATRRIAGPGWWTRTPVTVQDDVEGVTIALQPTATFSGRFAWAEGESPEPFAPLLRLEPADRSASRGIAFAMSREFRSTAFKIEGIVPGRYVVTVYDRRIVSLSWNGREYANRPVEIPAGLNMTDVVITMTRKSASLSGKVRTAAGTAADGGIIAFPIEREQWIDVGFSPSRLRWVETDSAGSYSLTNLPAGDYFVIAVSAGHVDEWLDAGFLSRAAPLATRVSLAWGQSLSQDLRLEAVR